VSSSSSSSSLSLQIGYKEFNLKSQLQHNLFDFSHLDECEVASQVVVADEVVAVDDQ
jgi:hypothetical protein